MRCVMFVSSDAGSAGLPVIWLETVPLGARHLIKYRRPPLMRWRRTRPCVLCSTSRIEAQARLAQQEAKAAAAAVPSDASSLAQMAVHGAPYTSKAPLIIGGDQPESYLYVGLNHGLQVWGHADIVAASIEFDGEEGPQAKHT